MTITNERFHSALVMASYFWEMTFEYIKLKNKEVQRSLQPLLEAYENITIYLTENPEYVIEILNELNGLREIILKMLSATSSINLCDGIKVRNGSLEKDLIMVDIRNLHSSLTTSWDTTIKTIQTATLELAAFFMSVGVGGKLIPTYLPYLFLSLMFFVAITYLFFSFRLILSVFFDIRRDVLACELGEREFLINNYLTYNLAPAFVPIFFIFPFQKRFDKDSAIFNDPIMIGLILVIVLFSLFETSIFYFYARIVVNYSFTLILTPLFFILVMFSFRLFPKLHYKNFGTLEKNLAAKKYKYIDDISREKRDIF